MRASSGCTPASTSDWTVGKWAGRGWMTGMTGRGRDGRDAGESSTRAARARPCRACGTMAPLQALAHPMRYEVLVGLRYTRSRKRAQGLNRFFSFSSLVSMIGTGLGVAALIVVLSVMNGFQEELRTRILGVASHVQVVGYEGEIEDWPQVADEAMRHPDVLASAPYVQEQGMLAFDQEVRGTMVRGVLPAEEDGVADFSQYMRAGSLQALEAGRFGVVLGRDLAFALRAELGDKITLIAPQGLVTPAAVMPRVRQFEIVGIFDAGMYEYDSGLALIHMRDAQA